MSSRDHQDDLSPDHLPINRSRSPFTQRLAETLRHYGDLGFISFGGPGVHVVLLRRRFVDKLKWLDATTFQDLFTLGNALPGPGSTQLAFSIAATRQGTIIGLIAFLLWSLPGAALMAGLGAGSRSIPSELPAIVLALLTGLNAAAVGLIAVAAYQLSSNAVTDATTRLALLGTASFGIVYHASWMYPLLVVVGGLTTLIFDYRGRLLGFAKRITRVSKRRSISPLPTDSDGLAVVEEVEMSTRVAQATSSDDTKLEEATVIPGASTSSNPGPSVSGPRRRPNATSTQTQAVPVLAERDQTEIFTLSPKLAATMGAALIVGIIALIVVRAKLSSPPRALDFLCNMLIAGIIIFGGGPVVVPLLRGYTVDNGWVTSRDFLLGFAILTAMPGPNFNFAVFLGILSVPSNPALGGVLGYIGIFTPGIMLKLALLPLYKSWRSHGVAKSVLRGLNAAASGLVYTAVWQLFLVGNLTTATGGGGANGSLIEDPWWGVLVGCSFVASMFFGVPPAFSIIGGGIGGLLWYAVRNH